MGLADGRAVLINEKNARARAQIAVANAQAQARAQIRAQALQQAAAVEPQVEEEDDKVQTLEQGPQTYPSTPNPQEGQPKPDGQLSPQQFYADVNKMKKMIQVQQKSVQQGRGVASRVEKKVEEGDVVGAPFQQQAALQVQSADVDAATFQLAGTKIGSESGSAVQSHDGFAQSGRIVPSSSAEMDVGGAGDPAQSHVADSDLGKSESEMKQRADHIDSVLNNAGISQPLSGPTFALPGSSHNLDNFRLGTGKLPPSISRSLSFMLRNGAPFASRESSMEFRRNNVLTGMREMSIDKMLRRDFSMDPMPAKKPGSREQIETELPRDMSIDFSFGNALRSTSRDFSMEMQFPHEARLAPHGAALELGALGDDLGEVAGFAFGGGQGVRGEPGKEGFTNEHHFLGNDARLTRSKIGVSQDDLMVHIYTGHQGPGALHHRGLSGSTEDFRELGRHPY